MASQSYTIEINLIKHKAKLSATIAADSYSTQWAPMGTEFRDYVVLDSSGNSVCSQTLSGSWTIDAVAVNLVLVYVASDGTTVKCKNYGITGEIASSHGFYAVINTLNSNFAPVSTLSVDDESKGVVSADGGSYIEKGPPNEHLKVASMSVRLMNSKGSYLSFETPQFAPAVALGHCYWIIMTGDGDIRYLSGAQSRMAISNRAVSGSTSRILQTADSPTLSPSPIPTMQPSTLPSTQPSAKPSTQPSTQPSTKPSSQPSAQPSIQPSTQPST